MEIESYLERIFSKPKYEFPIKDNITWQLSWDIIDTSTANYAIKLQEYNIAEILKAFLGRFGKNKILQILPKPGNLDIKDVATGFHDYYALLEEIKAKNAGKVPESRLEDLRAKCTPIVQYFITGKHPDKSKVFSGFRAAVQTARRYRKYVLLGTISIDMPIPVKTKPGKYTCVGTQHFVAFAFDMKRKELILFDSASRDPLKDETELTYMLRFTFEELFKDPKAVIPAAIKVTSMTYRNVLQPGAGTKSEENERSYNNQNVFCHTWSLWFSLVFICFYDTAKHDPAMKFLLSLSHRNPMLNLVMIKRFARWLIIFLDEDEKPVVEFPQIRFERSRSHAAQQQIINHYIMASRPFIGLEYVFNYKTKRFIKVDWVCRRRKVKLDVDILDSLEKVNIFTFKAKSQEIQCPPGHILNTTTKRCRKPM